MSINFHATPLHSFEDELTIPTQSSKRASGLSYVTVTCSPSWQMHVSMQSLAGVGCGVVGVTGVGLAVVGGTGVGLAVVGGTGVGLAVVGGTGVGFAVAGAAVGSPS